MLVGSDAVTTRLASYLLSHPEVGLEPIGRIGDDTREPDVSNDEGPVPRLGTVSDIERFAHAAKVAVVSLSADSSMAMTMVGTPWRARLEAICSPTTVLPVPLFPAIRVERPSGMPPSVSTSRPGTPVSSFFNALILSIRLHRPGGGRRRSAARAGCRAPTSLAPGSA